MTRLIVALIVPLVVSSAFAADSVILGRGISNYYFAHLTCDPGSICLDAEYVWVVESKRTLAGPSVKGRILALAIQHTGAIDKFVRAVELFVLSPIANPEEQASTGAHYRIVELSPRDSSGRYCLSTDPHSIGLKIDSAKVERSRGNYCFSAHLLTDKGV